MRRPPTRRTWRDAALVLFVAAVIALGLLAALDEGPGAADAALGTPGKPRDVPMERLLRRIEMNQLSGHPARYVAPVAE